jgi:hypothetical protein
MATKLTIKVETNYRDLISTSKSENKVEIESYVEGNGDTLAWRFEEFCKLLLAEGYSKETINEYLNYDGEVYSRDDV